MESSMAKKQYIKVSEARILVYLSIAERRKTYIRQIATKLNMDYCYLLGLLKQMYAKRWLSKDIVNRKTFYHLNKLSPLDKAVEVLSK